MKPCFWQNTQTNEIWDLTDHWHYKGIFKLDRALLDEDSEMKYYYPTDCSHKCIEVQK